ncbi:MAG: DNA repair protein RadA [Candidatus Melainabacteria bacterium]|nr:DNA repair protein RadA [Candidatus Melainabacteria bacterium]
MAKAKSRWVCQQCGFQTSRSLGRCTDCGAWGSLVEEISEAEEGKKGFAQRLAQAKTQDSNAGKSAQPITEIDSDEVERITTGMRGLDEVLGGGLVPGAVLLLAGDPGIGKSTLLMQVAAKLASRDKVLYITGEESASQVKIRAKRLLVDSSNVLVASEQNVVNAFDLIMNTEASVCFVDSIQSVYHPEISSAAGSVSQVREGTQLLINAAKNRNIATILVGHVTKEGTIAGPRVLEHMVDVVLQFEGDSLRQLRLIRAVKNRFGSTSELAIFSMNEEGLKEVDNPSAFFLADRISKVGQRQAPSGTAVIAGGEGTRSLLLEVQALTVATPNPSPRRVVNGWDYNRLLQLLAVLEKRAKLVLSRLDVYVNIVGGMEFADPAGDLGIALAVATSFLDRSIDPGLVAVGEVGLTGEIRPVLNLAQRLKEASRLGFTRALVPKANLPLNKVDGIEIIAVETIGEALDYAIPKIAKEFEKVKS